MWQGSDADGNRLRLAPGKHRRTGMSLRGNGRDGLTEKPPRPCRLNAASISLEQGDLNINLQLQLFKGPAIAATYCVNSTSNTYPQLKGRTSIQSIVLLPPSTWCRPAIQEPLIMDRSTHDISAQRLPILMSSLACKNRSIRWGSSLGEEAGRNFAFALEDD